MSERAVWQPTREVLGHDGSSIPPDLDFFVAPPRQIGPVLTAYSTLKRGAPAGTILLRVTIIGGSLFFGFCGGMMLPNPAGGLSFKAILCMILCVGLGLIIAFLCTSNHQCQYVGEDGVAFFDWKSSGPAQPSPKTVLEFRDATVLYTFLIEMFQNGVSQGTQYVYDWRREEPLPPFKYHGTVRNLRSVAPDDRYQFPLAAERAWTNYKMPILQAEFRETGSVTFPLKPGGYVRLSRKRIEMNYKRKEKVFSIEKIESITVQGGDLVFRRFGAKPGIFTKGKGIFTLPYSELGDSQLFLIVANTLLERASRQS